MKHILLSLAATIASSIAFTYNSCAQSYLGINPEHMPDLINDCGDSAANYNATTLIETFIKCSCKTSQATITKNGFLSSDNLHLSEFSDMYSQNGDANYPVFFTVEKASANNENDNDYTALSAAEILVKALVTRPPRWYITRMTAVLK